MLFLDEPTTGLDPASRLGMWDLIEELVAQGTTTLLTTQYLEEADRLADQHRGRRPRHGDRPRHADELKADLGGDRVYVTLAPGADRPRRRRGARRSAAIAVAAAASSRRAAS